MAVTGITIDYAPWQVVRTIGSGSFGTVYEIEKKDEVGVTRAALKVIRIPESETEISDMRSTGMDDQSVSDYFKSEADELVREIRLLASLRGMTNIVGYEDHVVQRHEDGIGWDIIIRMELLTSVTEYWKTQALTRKDVLRLGTDICRALVRCQKIGVIHRDIKPDNIFISRQGDYKLGDFGVARRAERTFSEMSKKGTPSYMAPEVYRGAEYGPTADIYSLGIVLYRLLNSFRQPFLPPYPQRITVKDQENALLMRMRGDTMPYPLSDRGRLAKIAMKACAYRPEDRYQSAAEMLAALERCAPEYEQDRTTVNLVTPVESDADKSSTMSVFRREAGTPGGAAFVPGGNGFSADGAGDLGGSGPGSGFVGNAGSALHGGSAGGNGYGGYPGGNGSGREGDLSGRSGGYRGNGGNRRRPWVIPAAAAGVLALCVCLFFVIRAISGNRESTGDTSSAGTSPGAVSVISGAEGTPTARPTTPAEKPTDTPTPTPTPVPTATSTPLPTHSPTPTPTPTPVVEAWQSAYHDFLRAGKGTYQSFALIHFDGDDIPELAVNRGSAYEDLMEIHYLFNGKTAQLGSFGSNGRLRYLKGQSLIDNESSRGGCELHDYYLITPGNAQNLAYIEAWAGRGLYYAGASADTKYETTVDAWTKIYSVFLNSLDNQYALGPGGTFALTDENIGRLLTDPVSFMTDGTDGSSAGGNEAAAIRQMLAQAPLVMTDQADTSSAGNVGTTGDFITIVNGIRAPKSDFFFWYSSSQLLTADDLANLYDDDPLMRKRYSQLAINEIFCRYGYIFTTDTVTAQDVRSNFGGKDWYVRAQQYCPSQDQDILRTNYMNSTERANIKLLNEWQDEYVPAGI